MASYLDEILVDVNWRISEMANLKFIPFKYNFNKDHKEIHLKYSIPAIYSIWEGFVKNCFTIYSIHLNSLLIKRNEIAAPLLTHQLDSICNFNNPRVNFESKLKMVSIINSTLTDIIIIKSNVPTDSNVNFTILNKILERFCIENVDQSYEKKLNKLLLFRNKIAHGENSILVNMDVVIELIKTVEGLMYDVIINIENSEKQRLFLNF